MNVPADESARKTVLRAGFTLIELSIVLVIIGLIVGGVLVGRDLIKAAVLRSVVRDIDRFNAATLTFEDKYNCLHGDWANATTLFGSVPSSGYACASAGVVIRPANCFLSLLFRVFFNDARFCQLARPR